MNENHEKEEWGAWKIVSDMLDKPDENGIYPTSECYQKLYEFVCNQKQQLLESLEEEIEKRYSEKITENQLGEYPSTQNYNYRKALEYVKALIQSKKESLMGL